MADQILSWGEVQAGKVKLLYHDNGDGSYSPVQLNGGGGMTKFTLEGIDAKVLAATKIATTDATKKFIITDIIVRCTAATAITVAATLSIGTNSATYNNIMAATALTGVTTANTGLFSGAHGSFTLLEAGFIVAANTDIEVKVTVAATGTSQTIAVDVVGYYP